MADFWEKFNTFPKEVQDYLLGDKSLDTIYEIGSKFKLNKGQADTLYSLLGGVSTKETPFSGLVAVLTAELGIDGETAKKMAVDIFGKYFLPVNEFYDGAPEKELVALGGKIKDYPVVRVMVKKESAMVAAEEVVKEFLPLFPDEVLRHRFLETVDSRLREVRRESDLREMLTRSAKVGGLGLDEETAGKVIEATAEKMRSVKIISDTEAGAADALLSKQAPAKEEKKESEVKVAVPPTPPSPPKASVKIINPLPPQKSVVAKAMALETKKAEAKPLPPKPAPSKIPSAPAGKENLLDALRKNVVPPPVNPAIAKKDIPTAVKKTGKDLSEAELDREIQHIKHDQMTRVAPLPLVNFAEIAAGVVSQSKIVLNPEQAARLTTILTARLKDIRDGQETKDILSRDYVMGGMSFAESQVGIIMPILEKEFEKISERLRAEAEEKISAERRMEEEKRKATAETSRLAEEQSRDKRFSELVGANSRKKVIPAPSKAPSGIPIVPSPAQNGKPKIQDIKYEPKLVGPVDEIGGLTLVDFRRLGATAKEAATKVREKIESLKAESIKKWQEGVSAWNGGEVNKLYLRLFGEALQKRKSLKDIIAGHEAAGEPSLSQDEINAIIELNRGLRF